MVQSILLNWQTREMSAHMGEDTQQSPELGQHCQTLIAHPVWPSALPGPAHGVQEELGLPHPCAQWCPFHIPGLPLLCPSGEAAVLAPTPPPQAAVPAPTPPPTRCCPCTLSTSLCKMLSLPHSIPTLKYAVHSGIHYCSQIIIVFCPCGYF